VAENAVIQGTVVENAVIQGTVAENVLRYPKIRFIKSRVKR